MKIKKIIRKLIGVRDNETISDGLDRKKAYVAKKIYKKKFSSDMLEAALISCGVSKGDVLFVHCSWRNMFNYDGTPEDVISLLLRLVGETGTILMPCYGESRLILDVDNTPSNAGVLSEVFRKMPGVSRSACTHFSVAGIGKDTESLLSEHIKSRYGFDKYSPCYKIGNVSSGKILFIGLGKEPTKISIFHCAADCLKNSDAKLTKLLSHEYESELIYKGKLYKKNMYIRKSGHRNNNATFKRIYRSLKERRHEKLSNVDIVVISAKEALAQAIIYTENGCYCYKGMSRL